MAQGAWGPGDAGMWTPTCLAGALAPSGGVGCGGGLPHCTYACVGLLVVFSLPEQSFLFFF